MATEVGTQAGTAVATQHKLGFNPDGAAIAIALLLAALIRLNLIPHIGW